MKDEIRKFISSILDEDYATANTHLKTAVDGKVKQRCRDAMKKVQNECYRKKTNKTSSKKKKEQKSNK